MDDLRNAVFEFARLVQGWEAARLEEAWTWGDYDEGFRFAFFRNLEELNDLAAHLAAERNRSQPQTIAQRLLAQYLAAYYDLQAIILGISADQAAQAPAAGEWPLRVALLHVIEAQRTFFAITDYAIARERASDGRPLYLPDEDWEAFWVGDPFPQLADGGPYVNILDYYDRLHERVLERLVDIQDAELAAPVVFWEKEPMPVSFRLGRFTSHLRQHSVQIEKALVQLGLGPNEAKHLLRLIYAALAEVDGYRLGAPRLGERACQELAHGIAARTQELMGERRG